MPTRRNLIAVTSLLALAAPFARVQANLARGSANTMSPYGAVRNVKDHTSGLELLKLPGGFSYQSYGWTGDLMDDGTPTPSRHDGMAVISAQDGKLLLMRNHERAFAPRIGTIETPCYDDYHTQMPGMGGGTTAIRFEAGAFVGAQATLAGTLINCAGGPTPWHSWLTCEETVLRTSHLGAKDHGYVFEVPDPQLAKASGVPIIGMGLMRHEAAAVDPLSGSVYLTEDNGRYSGFYRYLPSDTSQRFGALENGGRLEIMRLESGDLHSLIPGETVVVGWIPVAAPNADPELLRSPLQGFPGMRGSGRSGPFLQGQGDGAAAFRRGEGCWHADGVIYFVETAGGPLRQGALWAHHIKNATLTLLFASPSNAIADNPDNVTVSPRGGILICEDGGGGFLPTGEFRGNRLIGIDADGQAFTFCENNVVIDQALPAHPGIAADDYRGQEFAGATFDPTGEYLFVNIQTPGITFAISGPWHEGPL